MRIGSCTVSYSPGWSAYPFPVSGQQYSCTLQLSDMPDYGNTIGRPIKILGLLFGGWNYFLNDLQYCHFPVLKAFKIFF